MTWPSARGVWVHILDKLHWCVMETSFLVYTAKLFVQLIDGDASSAHTYGNYTENVLFIVFTGFLWPSIYGEKQATQEENLCTCFMDTTVHETELCTF